MTTMTTRNTLFALLSLATLATATAACGTEPDLSGYDTSNGRKLVYDHDTSRTNGTFQQNGVEVEFHFEHRSHSRYLRIASHDGFTLLESTTVDGMQSLTALETYHVEGSAHGSPAKFDKSALDDLAAMPEAQLLPELKKALDNAGVDISSDIADQPALGQIFCPTVHWVFDPTEKSQPDADPTLK